MVSRLSGSGSWGSRRSHFRSCCVVTAPECGTVGRFPRWIWNIRCGKLQGKAAGDTRPKSGKGSADVHFLTAKGRLRRSKGARHVFRSELMRHGVVLTGMDQIRTVWSFRLKPARGWLERWITVCRGVLEATMRRYIHTIISLSLIQQLYLPEAKLAGCLYAFGAVFRCVDLLVSCRFHLPVRL